MIKLKTLIFENFLSWDNLELRDIDKFGATLIVAKNGSGKSAIRKGLEYLLVDRTSDNLPLDELSKNGKGDCMLYGEWEKDDGTPFSITKYRDHSKHSNSIIFDIDGDKSQTATDRRVTKRNIAEFLGVANDNTLYSSTIFSLKSPSFPELKEGDRKPILFDILPLSHYATYQIRAKDKVNELKEAVKTSNRDIEHYLKAIENKETALTAAKISLEEYTKTKLSQKEELKKKLSDLELLDTAPVEERLVKARQTLEELKAEFDIDTFQALNKELDKTEKMLYDIGSQLIEKDKLKVGYVTELKQQIKIKKVTSIPHIEYNTTTAELEDLKLKFDAKSATEVIESLENIKKTITETELEIKATKKELLNLKDNSCPILHTFCQTLKDNKSGSEIETEERLKELESNLVDFKREEAELTKVVNENHSLSTKMTSLSNRKDELSREIASKTKVVEEAVSEVKRLVSSIGTIKAEYRDLKKQEEEVNVERNNLRAQRSQFETLEKDVVSKEEEISKLKTELKYLLSQNKTTEDRKDEYKEQITKIDSDRNPYETILESIEKEKKDLDVELKKVKGIKTNSESLIPYYDFWVKGYGKAGIPNMLCDEFLSALEYETNLILSSINDEMTVEIGSQDEEKEVISYKVFSPNKSITNFHSYSSGQQQRVKIANIFAFHRLKGFDFLILDELLEISLDEEGVESGIRLIKEKAKEVSSMFIMSHNDKIKDSFDKVLYINYENGNSSLRGG
jgi:DNA repair exonuclease SbcCD ATPase subunit